MGKRHKTERFDREDLERLKKAEALTEKDYDEEGWEEIEIEEDKPISKPKKLKASSALPIEILYQDDQVLVINKPSGLDSTRGQFVNEETVLDRLERQFSDLPESLRLVHRLDRDTSGVMVLAKTVEAQRKLCPQWETRTVEKTYLAIVHGVVHEPQGTIDIPLKKTSSAKRPVLPDPAKGKAATTEYIVLDQFRQYALVQAHPITGRMHQVRVHFASQGTPLLVDRLYGSEAPLMLSQFKRGYRHSGRKAEEKPLIARAALHAYTLAFTHPTTGERLTFKVEPPRDFAAAVKQLGKYGR
jgi:23S rRNA pseudouridine955/2504/2580 synthase/23S rRNA pseudouridine1911/1915/1917 synthase